MHEALQSLITSNPRRFKKEYPIEYGEIEGSVDLYDTKYKIPIEFKSHDTETIDKPHSYHEDQLKYYMAILNVPFGVIMYQLLRQKKKGFLVQFVIQMSEWERMRQLSKLSEEMEKLLRAVDNKDPSFARAIYHDNDLKWLCWSCPYQSECYRIRDEKEGLKAFTS